MDSSSHSSPFVEHSFRRLTRLIHQQEAQQKMNQPSEARGPFEKLPSDRPTSSQPRTYMRPPKARLGRTPNFPSSHLDDRLASLGSDRSFHTSHSPSFHDDEPKPSLVTKPQEPNLYQIKVELDRQNDRREKYDVPPPFQRQWLRQPRYTPQERPNHGPKPQSPEQ